MSSNTRTEKDPLGPLEVPSEALYGVQTVRAQQNFPISGLKPLWPFVMAQVWIKKAAAMTHKETGRLDPKLADAIIKAADEVLAHKHDDQFIVDPYQAGAGTSGRRAVVRTAVRVSSRQPTATRARAARPRPYEPRAP